jgi:dTDP-4-amino-4,6-dideoxygalactose transaminase
MQIPFLDIKSHYHSIKDEIDAAIVRVFQSGQFVGGLEVKTFEEKFASYHGVKYCISTGNGTDSLFAILKMLNVGAGDEVITPAWSWISTAETITATGATPIFADADPVTYNISIADVERKISSKSKVVMAVHLYGQSCNMEQLQQLCASHNLILMEDCAQAHGARRNGKLVGTFGQASSFSFYPTKNLGAFGDAGCMLTNENELAVSLKRFVNHGGLTKDEHIIEGTNSRMDVLQAAMLNVKLNYLNQWNVKRRSIADVYFRKLKDVNSIQLPITDKGNEHVYHLFVIRSKKRDALKTFLKSKGVETMIHYPMALPFEPAYTRFGLTPTNFPIAFQMQQEVLSLPCHPEMTEKQVSYICDCIIQFNKGG